MSVRRTGKPRHQALIAWPATDVLTLFRAISDALTPHLRLPIDPSKYPWRAERNPHANVVIGSLRWSLILTASDENETRRTSDHSGPEALKHHGAWVTLSSQSGREPDEEAFAFLRRFAEDYGGYLTLDEETWTVPAKACPFAGLDARKWEILTRIGFRHAPAIGAIMGDDDTLREVSELLSDEAGLRTQDAPGPR